MKLLGTIRTDRIKYDYGKIRFPIISQGEGELGPNTVGTDEIIDGSITKADLNKEITDQLDDIYVQDMESLYINGTKPE